MKRKLVAIWLVVCMTFTLCACTSTDKPQTDSESGEVVIPKTEETTETADQLQIVELTDVDPIAVQEIPIYEDITLKNNEVIDILDISESDSNNVHGNCSKDFEFKKALTPIQSGLRAVVCSFTLI